MFNEVLRKTLPLADDMTLVGQIQDECSGACSRLLCSLVRDPAKVAALTFREATEGLGTDEGVLIELCCGRTPDELSAIKKTYFMIFDTLLTRDISEDTSGGLKTFCLAKLRCRRFPEDDAADDELAAQQATTIEEALECPSKWLKDDDGNAKTWVDEDTLVETLVAASHDQRAAIAATFQEINGQPLDAVLAGKMREDKLWSFCSSKLDPDVYKACTMVMKTPVSLSSLFCCGQIAFNQWRTPSLESVVLWLAVYDGLADECPCAVILVGPTSDAANAGGAHKRGFKADTSLFGDRGRGGLGP